MLPSLVVSKYCSSSLHRQGDVGSALPSGSIYGVMVSTLTWNARNVCSISTNSMTQYTT